jgi:uncharacterized membrane protein YfcA
MGASAIVVAVVLGLLIGMVIGGLGGGGGVLTVPALVFALGQDAHDATTGSVVIVGAGALVGVLARLRTGEVAWRTGIAFGLVGIPAAYLGTALNRVTGQPVILLAFAVLTVAAAGAMLIDGRGADDVLPAPEPASGGAAVAVRTRRNALVATVAKTVVCGAAVGVLTGFLGVGGGFLVVPILVIVMRMSMSQAIGTSLLIITANSVSALASRLSDLDLDWQVVAPFAVAAIVSSVAGKRIADRLSGATLARAFAVMIMAVGLFVGVQGVLAL